MISWFGRMESYMALSTAEAKDVATFSRLRSLKRGSSSIAGETGCLSINFGEACWLLRHRWSCRLSSDVISLGKGCRLSLDVIIPDVILC